MHRILTEPESNLIRQQEALLGTEGLQLHFTDAAVRKIARVAYDCNKLVDNIGARRLHTVMERIVEEVSFSAPELAAEHRRQHGPDAPALRVEIDTDLVEKAVGELTKKMDLSRFIL